MQHHCFSCHVVFRMQLYCLAKCGNQTGLRLQNILWFLRVFMGLRTVRVMQISIGIDLDQINR